jgi:N-formylglutamate amidohydrolase
VHVASARRSQEYSVGPDDTSAIAAAPERAPGAASFSVIRPAEQTVPLVLASPHSGSDYPPEFVAGVRLSFLSLRRSEDAFVDRIFGAAPEIGAPLLKAHFPRVYVDPNREPYELDPQMFDAPLPDFVNGRSARVAAGLGTVAKVVATGEPIYQRKLSFAHARERIETHYFPYHQALTELLDTTHRRFGHNLLIDCHSMPSVGGPMDSDPGARRLDFVLGDCFGTACAPAIISFVEETLQDAGYSVKRNVPYAGGFTTRHYGRPGEGRHALQIEVNRALYMDEHRIAPTDGLARVTADVSRMLRSLAAACERLLDRR